MKPAHPTRRRKLPELVADEIKRWIVAGEVQPGERLPNEAELQRLFSVSKGPVREALKSLEVQGLVRLKTGPAGGASVTEVGFERTFQLMQNHFFFQSIDLDQIYALRRLLEPELAAMAASSLSDQQLAGLDANIACCAPASDEAGDVVAQGAEDLRFHDLIAEACPNPLLGFQCRVLNEMLRRLVAMGADLEGMAALAEDNLAAHRRIVAALRARDALAAREAMTAHMALAEAHVRRLGGAYRRQLVLDADLEVAVRLAALGPRA